MRTKSFTRYIFTLCVIFCPAIWAQAPPEAAMDEPGVKAVKSRWYRHFVMLAAPPWAASSASASISGTASTAPTVTGTRRGFMYEATIKNESGREVKAIHWDHVFLDPKTGKEMRRFHFFNDRQTIGSGKTKTLQRMTGHPPTGTIDVGMLEKDAPPYGERIEIKCVLFKGDVFWQAPNASVTECAYLKRKIKKKS